MQGAAKHEQENGLWNDGISVRVERLMASLRGANEAGLLAP